MKTLHVYSPRIQEADNTFTTSLEEVISSSCESVFIQTSAAQWHQVDGTVIASRLSINNSIQIGDLVYIKCHHFDKMFKVSYTQETPIECIEDRFNYLWMTPLTNTQTRQELSENCKNVLHPTKEEHSLFNSEETFNHAWPSKDGGKTRVKPCKDAYFTGDSFHYPSVCNASELQQFFTLKIEEYQNNLVGFYVYTNYGVIDPYGINLEAELYYSASAAFERITTNKSSDEVIKYIEIIAKP
jgi:hypothetical protein